MRCVLLMPLGKLLMVIGIVKRQGGLVCLATHGKDVSEETDREALWMIEVVHIHQLVYSARFS